MKKLIISIAAVGLLLVGNSRLSAEELTISLTDLAPSTTSQKFRILANALCEPKKTI